MIKFLDLIGFIWKPKRQDIIWFKWPRNAVLVKGRTPEEDKILYVPDGTPDDVILRMAGRK